MEMTITKLFRAKGHNLRRLPITFVGAGVGHTVTIRDRAFLDCEYGCEGTSEVPEYETDSDSHVTYIAGSKPCPHTYL